MNKKIKILLTIPNFETAGSGKSVYDMVKGLDRDSFEPEVCCFHSKGGLFKEVEKLGVKIHIVKTSVAYKPFVSLPFRVWRVARFFKKHQFDIIHSWHWSSDVTEPLAAKWAGIPFVYTKKAMGWGNKAWRWRSKLSTHIVSVNKEIPQRFFKNMLSKVSIIPLCVDTTRFMPLTKTRTAGDLTFAKEDFTVVSVANLAPVKGIELLCDAIIQLNDNNIKTVIVGDNQNDYGQYLKKTYKNQSNIFFVDRQLDVRPYLAIADIFVIPTKNEGRKEGLPIAPMEAMASERIVIGSNITGVNEVLEKFPECLFEAGNVEELKQKIISIRQSTQDERIRLAKAMRKYVRENLAITRFISEHQMLYRKILKR